MGRQLTAASFGAITRVGAVAVGCMVLANCSGPYSGDKYSPRVVEDGEPVPKGGGAYRVGKPYNINGRTYFPSENPSYRGEGVASWYGPDFHGRLTANGEVYDMHSLSAAHPTMPLPSYARVTNLDNGHSIIVRVNDRGPYAYGRIIDLSIGTAKALDFYGHGLARVRVEYVGPAPIEGSDDRVLETALRQDEPAPAPGTTKLAALRIVPVAMTAPPRTRFASIATTASLPQSATLTYASTISSTDDGSDEFLTGRGLY